MCFIVLFFKIVLFVLLYRDIKLVLLQQWAEIWRLDFFLVSMSNTRESSLLHLKLINSRFFKKNLSTMIYLWTSSTTWFTGPCSSSPSQLWSCCHVHSCVSPSHKPFSDRSRSEVPLWTQQVIHSQDCCQHHRWAKSASPRWAVKLDIINPVLSRINQERAAASENSLLPLQVKHETTVSRE